MCGRSSITETEQQLEEQFGKSFYSEDVNRYNPIPNYNIAPTHFVPVITNDNFNHFQYFRWGLIPSWAKDERYGSRLINARIETVEEKTSFKASFEKRRCLIPTSGYYEWMVKAGIRYPYRIVRNDGKPFLMAGVWDIWKGPAGLIIPTFTILTRDAPEELSHIHARIPGILTSGEEMLWLDTDIPPEESKDLLYKMDPAEFRAYPVSDKVNSVRNNDKSLIEETQPPEIQQTLF